MKHFEKLFNKRPLVLSLSKEEILIGDHHNQEQGFALLLVTFIIALISILIIDFTEEINYYQNSSRQYVEKVQAGLILKSSVALARTILETPKHDKTKDQDWLYEPWNTIAASNSIPLEGFIGELRIMIVDESGKIDINSLSSQNTFNPNPPNPGDPLQSDPTIFWKNAVKDLFTDLGFKREQYEAKSYRTLGNQTYDPSSEVAIITDWIDQDKNSYHTASFDGDGIESSAEKGWFFNRPLKSLSELAYIPGMTLEKIQRSAPFLKASLNNTFGNSTQININTAPSEVLKALGFTETEATLIVQQRISFPYNTQSLNLLITGSQQLVGKLSVKSNEFCLYSRVKMPRQTYWLKSLIKIKQYYPPRKTEIISNEFY